MIIVNSCLEISIKLDISTKIPLYVSFVEIISLSFLIVLFSIFEFTIDII